jgi:ABC-type glycerol-3-phosphate transport system substrate-binding protein
MSHALTGRRGVIATAATASIAPWSRAVSETPVHVLSHRYPALELFTASMREALPGVAVDTQLMPFDKMLEVSNIAMAAKSDSIDIVYTTDTTVRNSARNGWLRPLNDLWTNLREEFRLDDFADMVMRSATIDDQIYFMPHSVTVMLLFYRRDVLETAGLVPPATIAEFVSMARRLSSPAMAGSVSCLKPVDATLNEAHWYLNALGDGWFWPDGTPAFNSARGVAAIELLKSLVANAQQGATAAGNDECTVALQQGAAAMGLQWVTRARAMDNPEQSRVRGLVDWIAPPQGHSRVSTDGYAISAFSRQDPETLFRIIATSASQAKLRAASRVAMPPRPSLLDDPALAAENRFYPAAKASLAASVPFPPRADFYAIGEFIARRITQAVTDQLPVKQALDTAATEVDQFVKAHAASR